VTPNGTRVGRSVPGSGSGPWASSVNVPQPRSALVDPVSGGPSREWSWYWQALWDRTGQSTGTEGGYLPIGGGTMQGPLTLAGPPVTALQAATKAYVDAATGSFPDAPANGQTYGRHNNAWATVLSLAGGTMTGILTLAQNPVLALDAATKGYVDGMAGGIPEAPSNGQAYGRSNAAWVTVVSTAGGGIVAGPLQVLTAPILATDVANKTYVDSHGFPEAPTNGTTYGRLNAAWAAVLPLSGGTMTGVLTLAANPVNALDAATKGYVDSVSGGGGIPDAPANSTLYGRINNTWAAAIPAGGGIVNGVLSFTPGQGIVLQPSSVIYAPSQGTSFRRPTTGDVGIENSDGTGWSPCITQLTGDARYAQASALAGYLPLSGGALTGPLSVQGGITYSRLGALGAFEWAWTGSAMYAYVDGVARGPLTMNGLPLSGGQMTGIIVAVPGGPTAAGIALGDQATGFYRVGTGASTVLIPTVASYPVCGFTTTGLVISAGFPMNAGNNVINGVSTPVLSTDAANKAYVDALGTGPFLSSVTTDASLSGLGTAASPLSVAHVDGLRTS
jgi:uncharacterized membrane protein SpoIIM required for sporulation